MEINTEMPSWPLPPLHEVIPPETGDHDAATHQPSPTRRTMNTAPHCRFCGTELTFTACDLGTQPLANGLVPGDAPDGPDPRFPLRVMVCAHCLLVQLSDTVDPATMFGTYAYLSSVSAIWRDHADSFAAMAIPRFALSRNSLIIEAGSNDGTFLRPFQARGMAVLGIDPAANIADQARRDGIPTRTAFFGRQTAAALAAEGMRANLLIANNVMAHAPDVLDFVHGLACVLAPGGVLTIEVPDAAPMLRDSRFDTIYHEHVFYFSAFVLKHILATAGLTIFDAAVLPTHGGSLRLLARHAAVDGPVTDALDRLIAAERDAGLTDPARYRSLASAAVQVSAGLRDFLARAQAEGARVAAYGAAAKGTMLLNIAGITRDDIAFVADANPLKQAHRLPGCRIPVVDPSHIREAKPDYLLILPWNIAAEIMDANRFIAAWGGRFVIPSPRPHIIPA